MQLPVGAAPSTGESDGVLPTRVLIVDDHRVFAQALAVRLGAETDLEVVPVATSAEEVKASASHYRAHVVVMDIDLSGPISGIDLTATVRAMPEPPRVVVLTAHDDPADAVAAIQAGASGFVTKAAATDDLIAAIRAAARGQAWLAPDMLSGVLEGMRKAGTDRDEARALLGSLSPREREVMVLMVSGLNRAAMAAALFLSPNTIRTHTQSILAKLGVRSSVEAVALALRAGVRPEAQSVTTPRAFAGAGAVEHRRGCVREPGPDLCPSASQGLA